MRSVSFIIVSRIRNRCAVSSDPYISQVSFAFVPFLVCTLQGNSQNTIRSINLGRVDILDMYGWGGLESIFVTGNEGH